MSALADDVLKAIADGIAQHGLHTFNDKGAEETTPDFDAHVALIRSDVKINIRAILDAARTRDDKTLDNARVFISAVLYKLQDIPDSDWDSLMQDPEIEGLF